MTESVKQGHRGQSNSTGAKEWRRESNRQREVALRLAAEFQLKEKARRAKEHNEALSRVEKRAIPMQDQHSAELPTSEEPSAESPPSGELLAELPNSDEPPAESAQPLFKEGDQVWLFMERVKPGLTKKLAHRWHGPFRIKKKVEEFAYELELPDKSGYRGTRVTTKGGEGEWGETHNSAQTRTQRS
ncbi:hypothetical protein PF010_g20792 [Phytophthora fragariae]|uniref:Tf2-1-like SH3-like domain-containing protein n=1 Tax=Phytophthora fragariae TaxID=53985 RepID=A0A6A4C4F8_9STRA|nr:hypothetical protein PF003_g34794 [Phytophthora fragariae]KAE9084524.1 hypothetical protein PF010_g20792 [Phytophthora fragariae]KAE9085568.1 hypothetical protein PF007_g21094 [Phytophthora fragariae]KAE9285094.1 hypothetical protein PF001_g22064 [Phytophthora fragariae]KAE9298683.1 hypothetical protein PF008_g23445 [Phytophthora fragariae]